MKAVFRLNEEKLKFNHNVLGQREKVNKKEIKKLEKIKRKAEDILRNVIKTSENEIIKGCNDFPKGIKITEERLKRPEKYKWIEHAERNTILLAAKQGKSLDKSTMFLNWYPCIECARAIIQCGITKLVCEREPDYSDSRWGEQFKIVTKMLDEGEINVVFNN